MEKKKSASPAPKSKRHRLCGTVTLLDYCLELHDIFIANQNSRNPNLTFPTVEQLAVEFELTVRTMNRYLAYMRESLKLPVGKVPGRGGQGYQKPVVSFPMEHFSEADFLVFVMARKYLESGTPFGPRLRPLTQQLRAKLQGKSSVDLSDYEDIISFNTTGFDAPALPDPGIFDQLFRAAHKRQVVTVTHCKAAYQARPTKKTIKPLRIRTIARTWYVWNADAATNEIKKFAIHRISEVIPTGETFPPIPLDMEDALQHHMGAFDDKPPVDIELLLTGNWAWLVQERRIHESQKFIDHGDGTVTMKLFISPSIELQNWILSLGADAEIIAPAGLRKTIHAIHVAAVAKNA